LQEILEGYVKAAEGDDDERQLIRVRCALGHAAQQKEEYEKATDLLTPVVDAEDPKNIYGLNKATASFELGLCAYKQDEKSADALTR